MLPCKMKLFTPLRGSHTEDARTPKELPEVTTQMPTQVQKGSKGVGGDAWSQMLS